VHVHSPKETLFRPVLGYLRAKRDPPSPPKGSTVENEGAAATAVALRWGSHLAVLADSAKPIGPRLVRPRRAGSATPEMARINVEVSAALAEWIHISREDRGGLGRPSSPGNLPCPDPPSSPDEGRLAYAGRPLI
jgi:hypothetical protein